LSARVLDGRVVAREIQDEARELAAELVTAGAALPTIAVVRVGEDPASARYAAQIQRRFASADLGFWTAALPTSIDDGELARVLRNLSSDRSINGILLQLPLPGHLSQTHAVEAIDPLKDVDGVNPLNAGRLFLNQGRYFAPATPAGGVELLRRTGHELAGRRAVVVGRSEIVGRPLALLLLAHDATVAVCHSRTVDLGRATRDAEILAVAVGRPRFLTADLVAPGAIVLDFGINVVDGAVVGDVDYASVAQVAGAITPVPGGTGPMTNAMLLRQTVRAAEWQHCP
jgi:methylenetetrahydrofolate dehydrogenase (NADP+)/methenyltetrahydrofolate cyclohydrolase